MQFKIMVGGVETSFHPVEILQDETRKIILFRFLDFGEKDFNYFIKNQSPEIEKKLCFDDENNYVILKFVKDNKQYACDLGNDYKEYFKSKDGEYLFAFHYANKSGEYPEDIILFNK